MSEEKSLYWSNKYKERKDELGNEEVFLRENLALINKQGKILDLACGDGRNTIYLIKEGYDVLAVDFSREALTRLDRFAKREGLIAETKEVDVEDREELLSLGKFETIVINHYKPSEDTFQILRELLKSGGILIICTFNYRQNIEKEFPRKYCLEENELIDFDNSFELIKHEVREDIYGHIDGYIFRKK